MGKLLGGEQVSQGTFQLRVDGAVMINGDLVAVPVRFSGQRDGAAMDMRGVDLLTVRNCKIIEVASSPRTVLPRMRSGARGAELRSQAGRPRS